MDSITTRRILSVVGLLVAFLMLGPVNYAIENLHGNTTRAAIYLVIFIIGLIIAWMSVMEPVYQAPTRAKK